MQISVYLCRCHGGVIWKAGSPKAGTWASLFLAKRTSAHSSAIKCMRKHAHSSPSTSVPSLSINEDTLFSLHVERRTRLGLYHCSEGQPTWIQSQSRTMQLTFRAVLTEAQWKSATEQRRKAESSLFAVSALQT